MRTWLRRLGQRARITEQPVAEYWEYACVPALNPVQRVWLNDRMAWCAKGQRYWYVVEYRVLRRGGSLLARGTYQSTRQQHDRLSTLEAAQLRAAEWAQQRAASSVEIAHPEPLVSLEEDHSMCHEPVLQEPGWTMCLGREDLARIQQVRLLARGNRRSS